MKKTFLTVLSICIMAMSAYAQLTQGVLKMEISDVKAHDEQAAMGVAMLKGSELIFTFSKDKYRTTMDMMGGMMKMDNYVDTKSKDTDMLMDAMGQKIWVNSNLDKLAAGKKVDADKLDIKYDKKDTKEIHGYKAFKFTMQQNEGDIQSTVTGYMTDQIKTQGTMVQGLEHVKLPGTPLEITVTNKVMDITITTLSIDKKLPADAFAMKTEGYKKMTAEEFQKMSGGGMGMGF